jgi:hypothetical protein
MQAAEFGLGQLTSKMLKKQAKPRESLRRVKANKPQLDLHQFDKKRIGLLRNEVVVTSHCGTKAR